MVNQDSFTPQEYAKMVGMFPDPPQNPLPTGGYMDAGFDWVVHQAEENENEDLREQFMEVAYNEILENVPHELEWVSGGHLHTYETYDELVNGINSGEITPQMMRDCIKQLEAETFEADDDNYEKLLEQIEEKQEEIRYHEKMLDVAGYGRQELMELDVLKQELADLESLAFGAEGEQEFTISYTAYDVNTGEVIEESEVSVTASNEREARSEAMQMLEEGGLDDEEFVLQAETFGAEAQPISDEGELLVIRNDMGQTKGFIEMEEDLEDDSIEMEISDDEMEEIAEITLDSEFMAQRKQYPFIEDFGDLYVLDKTAKGNYVVKLRGGNVVGGRVVAELSPMYSQVDESFAKRVVEDLNGNAEQRTADLLNFVGNKTQAGYAQDIGFNRAETATYEPSQEPDMEAPATEPTNANFDAEYEVSIERKMIQHLDGVDIEADSQKELKEKAKEIGYERSDDFVNTKVVGGMDGYSIAHQDLVKESDFVKPSRDWFSLALGTAAVVIGGSLFLQNRGVFKADGDGTETAPSLVAHPSTGDLLPADYEEMVVESTGYAVPVIPVSLDPAFMGSRFHALPTDRTVESNEPGIGAHTDVAMTRDTNYREPEQTMVTEPPFAYKFNAEKKLSLLDRIKAFFMGHKDVKEANSVTGQTPYFGVGFEPKNPQTRVIKETRPISLDPSTAPYLPTNLSGYTGQSYTPPSVYSDMMQIGITGQTPSFVSSQSSIGENRAGSRPVATSDSLQSVHGNLSAGVNQSYTDGSKTMSLSQWSIEYDVSQISDSEAFAVSRSSGERTMIRRV